MEGFIKIHRQLSESKYGKNLELVGLFVHLLIKATHKDSFAPDGTKLKAGQILTSQKSLSLEFGVERNKMRRMLKQLESEHQIEQQTSSRNSILTVVNWSKYQGSEHQNEHQMNIKRTSNEHQMNTFKNVKNVKNVKKDNNTTQVSKFLVWFNEMKLQELGTKGRFASLKQTDINNLLKLKEAYKGDTKVFEHSFKAMCQNEWATSNNKVTPEHFLRNDNFQKYANTELKDNDKFKAAWQ